MSTVKWSPITAHLMNNAPNTIVIGGPGKGQKFYLDENGNKIEDKIKDKVEKDK